MFDSHCTAPLPWRPRMTEIPGRNDGGVRMRSPDDNPERCEPKIHRSAIEVERAQRALALLGEILVVPHIAPHPEMIAEKAHQSPAEVEGHVVARIVSPRRCIDLRTHQPHPAGD